MNVFDLFAKITLDDTEYTSAIDRAGNTAKAFGKIAAAGIGAASTAIGALGKSALEGYAKFEQLAGGVETLFGDAADIIGSNASEAFKTAGLSANEYMETVTSFSASLIQSLGGDTKAAAEYADQAIIDMADNANKMGTSIESIQNAYQGFAKQNYTMLDNLKLGYGGTKAEMQRLLDDAEKLSGLDFNITSFADITQAIHIVQENMGIAGATAEEASTTIEGSINAMKAAWQNLQTSFADGSLFPEERAKEFTDSVLTVASNIVPRLQGMLPLIADGLVTLVDNLLPYIPETLNRLLPSVVSGAEALVNSVTKVLPALITTAVNAIPQLAESAASIVFNFVSALAASFPAIEAAGWDILTMLTNGVLNGLPDMVARLPQIVDEFLDFITGKLGEVLEKGAEITERLAFGILDALPDLVGALPEIVTSITDFIVENFPAIIKTGAEITERLAFGILDALPDLVGALPEIITSITDFIVENFPAIIKSGAEMLGKLLVGILGAIPEIAMELPDVIIAIVKALEAGWNELKNAGRYLIEGLWSGISDKVAWLKSKVGGVVDKIKSWFTGTSGFDEHSPSKWANQVFRYVMEGGGEGLEDGLPDLLKTVRATTESVKRGLQIDPVAVKYTESGMGLHSSAMTSLLTTGDNRPIFLTIQSVLDGKVIGETSYQYAQNKQRMYGL